MFENNECYGSVAEHGIYVSNSGDRPVLRGNRCHDNRGCGIQLNADLSAGGDGIITGALIDGNVLYNNGVGGGAAINLDGVQDSTVRNNLIFNNHATGIVNYQGDGAAGPKGMVIVHNTVDQPSDGRWALNMGNTTGPNYMRNNILYTRHSFRGSIYYYSEADAANTDSDYNVISKVTTDGSNVMTLAQWQALGREPHSINATATALWVSDTGADYHLRSGSPAADAGQTLASVTADIEGSARPQGAASDIGCFEQGGTPPPPPPPDTTPPAPPTGTAVSTGDASATVTWGANTEADLAGYNVYRATAQTGPFAKQNTSLLTARTLTQTGLTNGTTYWYCVTAVDTTGNESVPGTAVSGTPSAPPPPPQVATLVSLSLSPTTVRGGVSSKGTVTLSAAAPAGGAVVALSSSASPASVPAQVTVPAGATLVTFTVTTKRVSVTRQVTISAAYQGVQKTAVLTLTRK